MRLCALSEAGVIIFISRKELKKEEPPLAYKVQSLPTDPNESHNPIDA
jgi:hypothetical protein